MEKKEGKRARKRVVRFCLFPITSWSPCFFFFSDLPGTFSVTFVAYLLCAPPFNGNAASISFRPMSSQRKSPFAGNFRKQYTPRRSSCESDSLRVVFVILDGF